MKQSSNNQQDDFKTISQVGAYSFALSKGSHNDMIDAGQLREE